VTKRLWTIRLSLIICLICIVGAESGLSAAAKSESEIIPRQYAPDRKVDILHITIDVTPDFAARTVAGTTIIKFAPIAKPLTELRLDALDLTVSSITSKVKIAAYSVTDEAITITFEPPVEVGQETTVKIVYEAEPKQGLYFRTPEMGYREQDTHLFTQGETHEAPHWYPNYDYPNERSTSEVVCRVPADMTVLSNGRLVSEETDSESGLKVVRWLQDKPHVNYLIALVAGKLKKVESKYRDIPIAFYTPASQIEYAENSFRDTADMLEFYEKEIGVAYPWDKYYQVVVQDFVAGGMENTTLTILTDSTLFTNDTENIRSSQALVAHELVHQWFGDYVTCKDWSHLWLNEGFAVYYETLYDGHKNGADSMLYELYGSARGILSRRSGAKPIVYRSYEHADEQFDYRAYAKGGWVLHMLRMELGEKMFRECVKTYLQRHALSSVVTEDFRSVIEELTGRSFDRFFDQWVYHGRHPDLNVSYSWSQKDKLAKVSVKQTHEVNEDVMLFHFRTKVRFMIDDEAIDREIIVDEKQHDFYFALPKEPDTVRFDPDYGLLAEVKFNKPTAMLYAQLENQEDVIGQLLAIEALDEKKDKKTIAKLKEALNNDPFYGVRKEASSALCDIHTDEAFDALAESFDQPDARVRLQVVRDIARFYRPESLALTKRVLRKEKNPAILAEAIRNLGLYHDKGTRRLLVRYLKSRSYRNTVADAAVRAIRMLDEPLFITPLRRTLSEREQQFTSAGFSAALDTLAHISRNQDNKTEMRNFLAGYISHPKRRIQAGAIRALGTLGDPKAAPIVETFLGDDQRDWVQRSAKRALEALREQKRLVPDEIIQLRKIVDELKTQTEKLRTDLKDIEERLEAKKTDAQSQKDADESEPEQPVTSDESDQKEWDK
jgi:aminopeptidase N